MYLKSIEIQGFKSFANKIVFEFHNGITGIVGPNGSGKSNVGDAVRWVLGEQSAKQLRGASMQDVIFSGTENRKPLGFAYVAITLDNSDHKLSVDYEEVTVARRVYRSGESEYLINGTSCRLKDVNELFYDTGIGKEGYSLIGQGQIDKILSGKPEERRELFDEAAGIVKYKKRKAAAQKKLEDEKQNLVRITDILSELEKQVAPLEKQSEKAKIYLKNKEELKIYDVNLFLMEADRIKDALNELEEKLQIVQNDLNDTSSEYENTKVEYERIEKAIELVDSEIEEYRNRQNEAIVASREIQGQANVLKEQINSSKLSDSQARQRADNIEKEISQKQSEKDDFLSKKEEITNEIHQINNIKKDADDSSEKIRLRINELNETIEKSKDEIFEIINKRGSTKGKIQRFDTMLEQLAIQKAQISQRLLKLKSDESEQDELLNMHKADMEKISSAILKLTDENKEKEGRIREIQEKLGSLNGKFNNIQSAYHMERSRLDSLKNITEKYDGYGNSIRRVMEKKESESGIIGVVADIIKVDKEYEIAVETALGGSIQNIVTKDEETAKNMIQYLKVNKYGRATFLPLTSVGNKNTFNQMDALKEKGVIGLASELVTTDEQYNGLVKYLLGRTIVADNIDNAILLARKYKYTLRIVTIEGESLSAGGSMTGGAFKNTSNLLGRRREIEELESKTQKLKDEAQSLSKEIESQKSERQACYDAIEKIKADLQEQYLLQNTAKININQAMERKKAGEEAFDKIRNEASDIERQVAEIDKQKAGINQELKQSNEMEEEYNKLIEESQKYLQDEKEKEAQLNQQTADINIKYSNLNQNNEFVSENIKRVSSEINKLKQELDELRNSIDNAKEDIAIKEEKIEGLLRDFNASEKLAENMKQNLEKATEKKEELTQNHKGFFAKREELAERKGNLEKEVFRLNNSKEKLDESKESQINYMWEEYELTYSSALELRNEEYNDFNDLKKRISSIREEIRRLGDVNVNAIEDYKNILERYTFLNEQKEDLLESEKALAGIIQELDSGMRKQFSEKFAEIKKEFDKVFKELFGGGKGTIELMDDEDILEAGIIIISQPPGKKLQNMMQLSGGEKALTAIALLFAIQNLKPSPFCLLDEIEAALDDSNVDRYAKYLHKLTKNTQFIIITHRRGTMAAADRLYGITMQEKGVSALVSVNLIEDDLDN